MRSVNLRRVNRSLRNPQKGLVSWVHKSDEIALATKPQVFFPTCELDDWAG